MKSEWESLSPRALFHDPIIPSTCEPMPVILGCTIACAHKCVCNQLPNRFSYGINRTTHTKKNPKQKQKQT